MVEKLDAALLGALDDVAATSQLLVALDFDGTLAPEVDVPEEARALPSARDAVLQLVALPHTRVAFVSGRALASLEHVSQPPDEVLLVGSHGIELRFDTPETILVLTEPELDRVTRLGQLLREVATPFEAVWVESKPAGFAMHTRLATETDAHSAQERAVLDVCTELPGLTIRRGKNVLEFSVRATTKGESIERLRSYTDATATFFAGDDVTDEDAFAALGMGDLGVKSGQGETVAGHRVAGPADVAEVLHELAVRRSAHLAG